MNKNAAIIEGDTTKKFNPVSKVKVSNSDTGESTWIPEESKTTHSLSVIKNGIYYAASEGYTAYDTVTVNVSSETEVNYEGIIADMPDLADLGLYDLDDLEGLKGLDLDLDELQDLENLILDGDLEEGEIPTSNTKIKGVDPDSGETLEVGLDEDGNLMEQALPDHIHIVVWPRKRHYQEGEILDFSGIHVYLMNAGTSRFTCEQYPTGEIPFGELIFPVTVAEASEETDEWEVDDLNAPVYLTAISYNQQLGHFEAGGQTYRWYVSDLQCTDTVYFIMLKTPVYEDGRTWAFVSRSSFTVSVQRECPPGWAPQVDSYGSDELIISEDVKAYASTRNVQGYTEYNDVPVSAAQSVSPQVAGVLTLVTGHKKKGDGQEIPVQWMRSDGEILEDTYTITIGDGEDPEPEPDPYAGACDFIWEGKAYCFNKSLARSEVMYSNGTVWQTWLGGQSPPYTVDQALKLKLIVQVGWSGGGSTSGGF